MRTPLAICVVLLGGLLPGVASAAQGVLLLADEGKAEWSTYVRQLAAQVDQLTPTEVAFWPAATPNLQAAVNRLVERGVSEIVAVPVFVAAPPSELGSRVKSPVPLRVTASLNGDPIVADILLRRAQGISRHAASEVLVLVSQGPMKGSERRWVPDLAAAAQQLNRGRHFAMILAATVPPDASDASAKPLIHLRRALEGQIAMGRQILIVPVLAPYGGTEPVIEEQLQGLAFAVAKSAQLPDDQLVAWIVSRADAAARAGGQRGEVR